ncbi:hypothetical protein POL68_11395 [Stigmatella sp. ncwal1]|uniref:Uncharacterized protein n=1 Tax=Stigmatella ashevillensis TaxID=2995309 RepID=A0ABT5D9S6_9BACT|nr:hypothetical protein [Stigmatella ashevillena]MDC0709067.1 hypothetical protein [Stigmatella ashevillena]
MGEDQAVLDLFFFAAADAPQSVEEFEQARGRARRVETKPFGYDWGDWEFEPSLNYRQLLMDDEDVAGIWAIQPFNEEFGEGSPVSIEIPEDEQVWAVNYCPQCRELFVGSTKPTEEPCLELLRAIAEHLEMDFTGVHGSADKAPFIKSIRERIARRRP